jgi:preprotein translocase subunit YajC
LTVLSTASLIIAQATQQAAQSATSPVVAPTTQGRPAPGFADLLASPMFPLILGIIVLYFFMYRSKRNQDRQLKEQLGSMKRGDRVMTAGGVLGKVVEVEDSKVLLKVDEGSNTKIWFTRDAIRRVLTDDKAETAK